MTSLLPPLLLRRLLLLRRRLPLQYTRPRPAPLDVPAVVNLGSRAAPYYHADGFFPAAFRRNIRVLAPSCRLPPSKWALRRLTAGEWSNVFDFPVIPPWGPLFTPSPSTVPGKLLSSALEAALALLTGGGPLFSLSSEVPVTRFTPPAYDEGIVGDRYENYTAADMGVLEQDLNLAERRKWARYLDQFFPPRIYPASSKKGVERKDWEAAYRGSSAQPRAPTKVKWSKPLVADSALTHATDITASKVPQPALKAENDGDRKRREQKATKADDALVPEYLWLEQADQSGEWAAQGYVGAEMLQHRMLVFWKRKILREGIALLAHSAIQRDSPARWVQMSPLGFYSWTMQGRVKYKREWQAWMGRKTEETRAVIDALKRALRSTWWEWKDGSAPFYWRWPTFYRRTIREGLKVYFIKDPPRNLKPQRHEKDQEVREKVRAKLAKVRDRRYIGPGRVESLTSYFSVPKGEADIRMVYDGTASGLNDSIWVPSFGVPTIRTHLRMIGPSSWMADLDVGEMFLNFFLHEALRALAGVDLTPYFGEGKRRVWETWQRAAMGLKSSPYQATQALEVAEEVIKGNRHDQENVFRWDRVELNLPGAETYDPTKAWVMKLRVDGTLAADFVTYVDDVRPVGGTIQEAWRAAQKIGKTLTYLGVQSASRKRRSGSQSPGAWAGTLVETDGQNVWVTVSQEKWDKVKRILSETQDRLSQGGEGVQLNRKQLERDRGFLNYVVQTFPCMTPYLIGYHMTIDSWRPGRDEEGWRQAEPSEGVAAFEEARMEESSEGPEFVRPVPRFRDDLSALQRLTAAEVPLRMRARARKAAGAFYGFGDASRAGFGASIKMGDELWVEYGNWSREVRESSTSNWRELSNLVSMLKKVMVDGQLIGAEIFIFTDNSTAEAAFSKGTSKSRKLFELVLELKVLEVERDVHIHLIHVSGKRMIHQGTDGLSRADKSTGVMAGEDMLTFIPLHHSAVDRCPALLSELKLRLDSKTVRWISPSDWYEHSTHRDVNFWFPPPAATDVVAEQLMKARHKRPHQLSVVIVPRLFTGRWRRRLGKCTDGSWVLRVEQFWPLTEFFEPLLIFVAFPYRSEAPKFECRSALLEELGGILSGCFTEIGDRKFPVRRLLDEDGEELPLKDGDWAFGRARAGDHLMTPFQCGICHFRNMMGRDPNAISVKDQEVLSLIRRASLDAFWARASTTVGSNLREARRGERFADRLGLGSITPPMGPFPLDDVFGMKGAIMILDRSLDPGIHEEFVQWDTFRTARSAITNISQAGVDGLRDVVGAYERNRTWISKVPTHSFWFTRFMQGVHKRVGEYRKQDEVITIDMMKQAEIIFEREWRGSSSESMRLRVAEVASWFYIGFCTGLRGEEMVKIEWAGSRDSRSLLTRRNDPHFLLVVAGQTKGNQVSGAKFGVPCIGTTNGTNLVPGKWFGRMVDSVLSTGGTRRWLFQRKLNPPRPAEFEGDFFRVLQEIKDTTDLIEEEAKVEEDFGIARSLRRGFTVHARNMRISNEDIRAMNRWRSELKNGGQVPRLDMLETYSSLRSLTPLFLSITKAL